MSHLLPRNGFRRINFSKKISRRTNQQAIRCAVESLEERLVFSTFTVTTISDSGVGSLRQAIADATADVGSSETINFNASLTGTISLSTVGDTAYGNSALLIGKNITIDGNNGAAGITIGRTGATMRLFAVSPSGHLTLNDLTLSNGLAQGAAGSVGYWSGGGGAGLGGAIFSAGTLTVTGSTFTGNQAVGGSGIGYGSQGGGGAGGGLGARPADASNSNDIGATGGGPNGGAGGTAGAPAGNGGFGGGGGGGASSDLNTTNQVGGNGGFGGGGGSAGLHGGNTINDFGGNGGFGGGGGGGGFIETGVGTDGTGGFAGGDASDGTGGGGAGLGGAIFNYLGTLSITDSTLTANTAQGGSGGNAGSGFGGGVFNYNGSLTLLSSTLSLNTADGARGVYTLGDAASATATINDTVIGQSDTSTTDFVQSTIHSGSASSSGVGNAIRTATAFGGTIATTANPALGTLANNGGETQTMLPGTGSPLIDAGNNAAASGLSLDQRGNPRVSNSTVDIGSLEVGPVAPSLSSVNHATFTVGSAGSFTVTTTGLSVALTETGALPGGVTFVDNGDGTATLAGTPSAGTGASYTLSVKAANGTSPDATQSFTLTVDEAPAISSANHATFTVGSAGTFSVTSVGFPIDTLSETGSLPSGVTFVDNHNGTATLAGTPAAATGASYVLSLRASNGIGSDATQSFTLTVDQAPAIVSANHATFTTLSPGSFTVSATGFPADTLSETGTLPAGVTFNPTSGVLSGTPSASTGGTYVISFGAANGISPDATQSFTLTVDQAPAISSANSATFTVGSAGTFTVTSTGFPIDVLTETNVLPTGVTFVDNHNGTATLAGSPAAATGGSYVLSLRASNGIGSDATQSFTLTVDQAPGITSANHATFTTLSPGSFTVIAPGFPADTLSETGTLPTGVTFNPTSGALAGTPAALTGGTYLISFNASNGVGTDATQSFTLTVDDAPAITSANHVTFTAGTAGSFVVHTSGFPLPALNETGALPTGITFVSNNDGTATISGTAAFLAGGAYPITIAAGNSVGTDASQNFTLTVNVPRPILVGPGPGGSAVQINNPDGSPRFTIANPFPNMNVGVRLTLADMNGDGTPDVIAAAGTGGEPRVKIFDGSNGTKIAGFLAFEENFPGGVFVAAADVNHDGHADLVTSRGFGAAPEVKVFDGTDDSVLADFNAFDPSFAGGVRIAADDFNSDGFADIVTIQGPGGVRPQLKVFDGQDLIGSTVTAISTFYPFGAGFTGGGFVATGDITGDGTPDIIVSKGAGGGPRVRVFDGTNNSLVRDFLADSPTSTNGVRVAAYDLNGDGSDDIVTAGGIGSAPVINVFSGADGSLLDSFQAYHAGFAGGVFVG